MFESNDRPESLSEDQLNEWFEKGRAHKISYEYLLIVWDEYERIYSKVLAEDKKDLKSIQKQTQASPAEKIIAVYDLFSESRIS